MLGSEKQFVVTEALTHTPGHGAVYQCSEQSVIPLSYPGAPQLDCQITSPFNNKLGCFLNKI